MIRFTGTIVRQVRTLTTKSCLKNNITFDGSKSASNIVKSPYGECKIYNMTAVERFFETSSRWPQNVAMECSLTGRKYTYGELQVLIRRFGSSLSRMGFKQGEVLGIVLPNIPEFPIVLFGASGIGMPVALINPLYTAEEISRLCTTSKTTVVVGVTPMAPILLRVAQLCPSVRRMVLIGEPQQGFVSITEMLADSGDLFKDNIEINPDEDIFLLPHSSGTTGPPKSVLLTHSNVVTNISQATYPGTCIISDAEGEVRESYVGIVPFYHMYGMTAQLLTSLYTGGHIFTVPKFDAQTYLQAIDKARPTILYVVPPVVSFLAQFPALNLKSFDRLVTMYTGGAAAGKDLSIKMLEKLKGVNFSFQEGFGLTETSPAVHFGPLYNAKLGSVGSPVSRTEIKIIDVNSGEALGPDQRGELCIRGPQVMKGYLNNPEATRENIDSSGWLRTGDIAYYDQDGHFFLVDRLKELIKVKGEQVSPTELEEILRKHPGVAEVGVVGAPDEYAGEIPRAYVVKKAGTTVTEEELLAFIHPKVASYKYLKGGVRFIDQIPKSNTGKILRRQLKLMAMEE